MKRITHVRPVTQTPVTAQISNYQIKLESITEIIDRLLLAQRQQPWKATGPSGTTSGTGTSTGTSTSTLPTQL